MYRTITLPVVLYGCETWSVTLREEQRLRVYKNRVVRKTFGNKWDEVTGKWRRLHNEELYDLYSSPNTCYSGDQIKKNEMGRECNTYGGEEMCRQGFGGET
jgi:hypothetical protein